MPSLSFKRCNRIFSGNCGFIQIIQQPTRSSRTRTRTHTHAMRSAHHGSKEYHTPCRRLRRLPTDAAAQAPPLEPTWQQTQRQYKRTPWYAHASTATSLLPPSTTMLARGDASPRRARCNGRFGRLRWAQYGRRGLFSGVSGFFYRDVV